MTSTLFSTYKTGENRVTSTTMAVFERIDLTLVTRILATASGAGDELDAVTFRNQVVGDGAVPDAVVSANFTWLFETKTERGQYDIEGHSRSQLRNHAKAIAGSVSHFLFVLTPDSSRPDWFDVLNGVAEEAAPRINWISFKGIADAIEQLIASDKTSATEHVRFLLFELIDFYEAEGLLTSANDTVIVAARWAWKVYQDTNGYFYQTGRAFKKDVDRLGFYYDGSIMPPIAKILDRRPGVLMTHENASTLAAEGENDLSKLITSALEHGSVDEGATVDLFRLSGLHDAETTTLPAPIRNDTETSTGRRWAWTLGQRYTRLSSLQKSGVTKTSQIE